MRKNFSIIHIFILVSAAFAQHQPRQSAEPAKKDGSPEDQEIALRLASSLIIVPVFVTFQNNSYVKDLRHTELRVFENGKELPIDFFSADERPFDVVLAIGTAAGKAEKLQEMK